MKDNATAGLNTSSHCSKALWVRSFFDHELPEDDYALPATFFIVNTTLLLISTIGNALVFSTIVYFKQLHITPNIGMANLAGASCLTGLVTHSFLLTLFISEYNCVSLNDHKFFFSLNWSTKFFLHGLLFSVCLVTVERYIGIVYCLRYTTILSMKKMIWGVIAAWTVSLISSFLDTVFETNDIVTRVIINITRACIMFSNLVMLRISYKQRKQVAAQQMVLQTTPPPNFRGAFTVAFIFLILCVTEIPVLTTRSILERNFAGNQSTMLMLYPWFLTLFISKTTLYFLVYFWRSCQLRCYTKKLCEKIVDSMKRVWK